jgi:hypothetical protein
MAARDTFRAVDADARFRRIFGGVLLVAAIVVGIVLISLPFHYEGPSKGPAPLPALDCRTPILIGWAGGSYSEDQTTCGGAARVRLVAGLIAIALGGTLLTVVVARPHKKSPQSGSDVQR